LEKFFRDTNGEIYITEATCQLYTMKINDVKSTFQEGFKAGLRTLHYASTLPTDNETGNKLFSRFVQNYGTHYIVEVSMGAKLWIETRFTSQAKSKSEISNRMNCIHKSLSSKFSVGFEVPDVDLKAEPNVEVGSNELYGVEGGVTLSGSTTLKGLSLGYGKGDQKVSNRYSTQ
jgi:hypothetical protein